MCEWLGYWRDFAWRALAHRLPRRLVYFATIRLGAEVTCGRWGNTEVPALKLMDAISRWEAPMPRKDRGRAGTRAAGGAMRYNSYRRGGRARC